MESMALSLKQRQYVEAVIAVLPHLAEAVAAIPRDCQVKAFEAAERSYLRTFRQLGLSGPETWASSIMRRLRRRVWGSMFDERASLKSYMSNSLLTAVLRQCRGRRTASIYTTRPHQEMQWAKRAALPLLLQPSLPRQN